MKLDLLTKKDEDNKAMVGNFPARRSRLDLLTKRGIAQEVAQGYRKASKRGKGRLPNGFGALTEYEPSYAAWALRKGPPAKGRPGKAPPRPTGRCRRGGKLLYAAEARRAPVKVWAVLGRPRGKGLEAAMPETGKAPEGFGEIELGDGVEREAALDERHRL